jgi:hypothetical protein
MDDGIKRQRHHTKGKRLCMMVMVMMMMSEDNIRGMQVL